MDQGDLGASCFTILTDKERDVEKEDWDKERFKAICTQPKDFGEWKAVFLKLCHENKRCKPEDVNKFNAFMYKLEVKSAQVPKP